MVGLGYWLISLLRYCLSFRDWQKGRGIPLARGAVPDSISCDRGCYIACRYSGHPRRVQQIERSFWNSRRKV
ncbi:hypothetical protein HOY80DRAFT_176993 [Tuber brumale]|nr:hypothetical protein HOY80DRAFT_176993 [Tuber brumale]